MKAIYLDANILIFAFERSSAEGAYVWPVLEAIEAGEFAAITSQITLSELLPKPLELGQTELAEHYEYLFRARSIFETLPVTLDVLSEAARIRARRMSTTLPDAIHLATARLSQCMAFLTGDKRLLSSSGIATVSLAPTCLTEIRSRLT